MKPFLSLILSLIFSASACVVGHSTCTGWGADTWSSESGAVLDSIDGHSVYHLQAGGVLVGPNSSMAAPEFGIRLEQGTVDVLFLRNNSRSLGIRLQAFGGSLVCSTILVEDSGQVQTLGVVSSSPLGDVDGWDHISIRQALDPPDPLSGSSGSLRIGCVVNGLPALPWSQSIDKTTPIHPQPTRILCSASAWVDVEEDSIDQSLSSRQFPAPSYVLGFDVDDHGSRTARLDKTLYAVVEDILGEHLYLHYSQSGGPNAFLVNDLDLMHPTKFVRCMVPELKRSPTNLVQLGPRPIIHSVAPYDILEIPPTTGNLSEGSRPRSRDVVLRGTGFSTLRRQTARVHLVQQPARGDVEHRFLRVLTLPVEAPDDDDVEQLETIRIPLHEFSAASGPVWIHVEVITDSAPPRPLSNPAAVFVGSRWQSEPWLVCRTDTFHVREDGEDFPFGSIPEQHWSVGAIPSGVPQVTPEFQYSFPLQLTGNDNECTSWREGNSYPNSIPLFAAPRRSLPDSLILTITGIEEDESWAEGLLNALSSILHVGSDLADKLGLEELSLFAQSLEYAGKAAELAKQAIDFDSEYYGTALAPLDKSILSRDFPFTYLEVPLISAESEFDSNPQASSLDDLRKLDSVNLTKLLGMDAVVTVDLRQEVVNAPLIRSLKVELLSLRVRVPITDGVPNSEALFHLASDFPELFAYVRVAWGMDHGQLVLDPGKSRIETPTVRADSGNNFTVSYQGEDGTPGLSLLDVSLDRRPMPFPFLYLEVNAWDHDSDQNDEYGKQVAWMLYPDRHFSAAAANVDEIVTLSLEGVGGPRYAYADFRVRFERIPREP